MDKKFVSGAIFGVILGTAIGVSTPMFGAKDIVIKQPAKQNTQRNTTSTQQSSNSDQQAGALSGEASQLLKDISSSLKENSEQNKEIIQQLNNLNKKQGL